jgi:Raf kinase inhibitor-like YbhB/YbcL family protein
MEIHSIAFSNGSPMPLQYTCDGKDISPPLNWTNPPAATRSFVLLCDDPDAPGGTWHHWAVYDLPDREQSLAEGASRHPKSFKQAINDFHKNGYGGPCPPHEHGLHHYHFRLLALSVEQLPVHKNPTCDDVAREARKYTIAEANLMAVYER